MKDKILLGGVLLTLSIFFVLNGISYGGKAKGKIDNTVDLPSSIESSVSVTITSPTDGAIVGGRSVPINYTFSSSIYGHPVWRADFYVDGVLTGPWHLLNWPDGLYVGSDTFILNTTLYTDGIHTLMIKVYADFDLTTSDTINVTISNPVPTVTITSPLDGAVVGGRSVPIKFDFKATPPSDHPVWRTDFYVDGVLTGPWHLPNWPIGLMEGSDEFIWNTTYYAEGKHTIEIQVHGGWAGGVEIIGTDSIKVYVGQGVLSKVSGDNQQAPIKTTLYNPLVIKVATSTGVPISGIAITFDISGQPAGATGALLSVTDTKTDANGLASTSLTLGDKPGTYTVTATGKGTTPASVTFTEEAVEQIDYILITPKEGIICVGSTQQFITNGWTNGLNRIKEDGGGDDVNWGPVSVIWTTSVSSNVGTIDENGLFTAGNTPGTGTVTATHITAGSDTANISVFGGDVIGPSTLLTFKHRNAPHIELSALSGQPAGVEYLWKVTEGEDKVQIDDESVSLSTFKLKGIQGSISQGDIKVTLTYTLGQVSCHFSKSLTVLKPTKLTHPPLEFFKGEVKFGRTFLTVLGTNGRFLWTLFDQFNSPLANVPCRERIWFDMRKSIPKRFIPIPIIGTAITDKNGQFTDIYLVQIFGEAPPDTLIIAYQKLICGGFEGDNTINITISDVTTFMPVLLE